MERIDPQIYNRADDELKALIDKARISALSDDEYSRYEAELKILSDQGTAERYGYDRGVADGEAIGREIGKEIGRKIGKEEGRNEERAKLIQNLRSAGFSYEEIAKFLNITPTVNR